MTESDSRAKSFQILFHMFSQVDSAIERALLAASVVPTEEIAKTEPARRFRAQSKRRDVFLLAVTGLGARG
jgi:hypothetical protein